MRDPKDCGAATIAGTAYKFEHPMFKDIEFRGILEVLSEKSFRMEGVPSNLGERPEKFTKDLVIFREAKD